MCNAVFRLVIAVSVLEAAQASLLAQPLELLAHYAANQDLLTSWRIKYDCTVHYIDSGDSSAIDMRHHRCDIRREGERIFWRWYRWGGVPGTSRYTPEEKANYLSLLWDGEVFSNYRSKGENEKGVIVFDSHPPDREVNALKYENTLAPLMGYFRNAPERVDAILREATEISLRDDLQPINDVNCFAIDARTKYGDYTVWIDPAHGYNFARIEIRATQAEGHISRGSLMQTRESFFQFEVVAFREYDGAWVATEGRWTHSYDHPHTGIRTTRTHVKVTELMLSPDHEAAGSFVRDDVGEGTWGWVAPHLQIRRLWRGGEFAPEYDEAGVALIDQTLTTLLAARDPSAAPHPPEEPNVTRVDHVGTGELRTNVSTEAQVAAMPKTPGGPHPHCGLYCIYALTKLADRQLHFTDLVKPEYLGHREGSSLLELRRAAHEYGLHAESVSRLTTSALTRSPYWAILHVRGHAESTKYDHYELFLGTQKGEAKLWNPPEPPRTVQFADLAPRWDGLALFVSDGPVNTAVILAADRQRWLTCGLIGVVIILVAQAGRRIWLGIVGVLPRSWSLGLSMSQCAALGLGALLCGGLYHFAHHEGLLVNATATEALQRGHAADFITKVSEKKVRRLLGTETVFVDARFAADYDAGHLDDAISLPIDANDAIWAQTIAGIPRRARVVTYCQSAGCKFAEKVSLRLIEEGYCDVSLFKGGWVEWAGKHGRPEPPIMPVKEVETKNGD